MTIAPVRPLVSLLAGLAVGCWGGAAHAHGPPPFIVRVAAADAAGPTVLVVTEGLVQRREGGWIYVCPSLFGFDPAPPALSVDGRRTYVSGGTDLHALDADGAVSALGVPELARGDLVALVASRGRVHGVVSRGDTSEIRTVDGAAPLWSSPGRLSAAWADDGGFWLGGVESATGTVTVLSAAGEEIGRRTFALSPDEVISALHPLGSDILVALVAPSLSARLLRVGADGATQTLLETTEPLRGVTRRDAASVWAATDGRLHEVSPGGAIPFETSSPINCAGRTGGLDYACAGTRLLALGAEGPGAELASLAEVRPPAEDPADPELASACQFDWARFHYDLTLIGVLDAGAPRQDDAGTRQEDASTGAAAGGRARAGGGCAATRARAGASLGGFTLLFAILAARRRCFATRRRDSHFRLTAGRPGA